MLRYIIPKWHIYLVPKYYNTKWYFQIICINLHSNHQYVRESVDLYLLQDLVLSDFLIFSSGVGIITHHGPDLYSLINNDSSIISLHVCYISVYCLSVYCKYVCHFYPFFFCCIFCWFEPVLYTCSWGKYFVR